MNKEEIDLFEFGGSKKLEYLNEQQIKELKLFLKNVWENRKDFSEYNNEDFSEIDDNEDIEYVSELKKQPFLSFDGKKVRARNYIGFIEFENYRINIYPKIFKTENARLIEDEEKKEYFKNILYWFSYCKKIKFPFNQLSTDFTDFENLLEVFIFIFASYTQKIMSEKPYSRYHEVREETTYLRGSLAISEYTRENLITGKWHHFYCNYEPFIYNNLFNQIVKYVSKMLLSFTKDSKSILENILFILDEVDDKVCVYSDCNKVSFNRLYEDLDLILTMCKMFLSGQILDSSSNDKSNFCFLLPMEQIFEEFIFNFIVEEVKPELGDNWVFKSQASDFYLTQEEIFKLKHDILCKNFNLIIDTKYKIRNKNDKKCGISQGDMYQMVSYAIRRGYKNILLLYPQFLETSENIFKVEENFSNQIIEIKAIDINILRNKKLELKEQILNLLKNYI